MYMMNHDSKKSIWNQVGILGHSGWGYLGILIFMLGTGAGFSQKVDHVILISIDGFRPDFYLDPSWGMVNLRQMMENGVYAEGVNSVFPTVTFPNHTTMITGVKPDKHGIYYNNPFDPESSSSEWHWYSDAIKSKTLWDALYQSDDITVSVNWPVSVGAPVTYNIPIFKEKGSSRLEAIEKYTTPKGLLKEVQKKATGELDTIDFGMEQDYLILDENIARISGYLIRQYKPVLTTVRLSCVDHYQHLEGRDGDMVRRAVSGVDRALRTIMEAIERADIAENTAVIIAGDHGFVNRHTMIAPNIWLARAGLQKDFKSGQWKAKFHTSGGSAFLMLNDKKDNKTLQKVLTILSNLPDGQKKLFKIIERKELENVGADPNATLALAAIKGVAFSAADDGDIVRVGKGGTHGYFPDFQEIRTGLVCYGAGFKKGVVIPIMGMEDIAPMIAELLGITLQTTDGTLYPGMFSNQHNK